MISGPNQTFDSVMINYLQGFDAKTEPLSTTVQIIGLPFFPVEQGLGNYLKSMEVPLD
jgi:hypothetical protein